MFGKMEAIAGNAKKPEKMDSFRKYIGRKVISKSGDNVGKVHDFLFTKGNVEGIVISRGLSSFFIERKFVNVASDDDVMISINTVLMHVGKQVFDADGKKLGKVVDIVRKGNTNNFDALIVRRKLRKTKIPKSDIDVSKKNIILKKK